MNLARKYDETLRRKYSYRAVWLPGTEIKIGDILIFKDGALVSIGNIGNEGIPFEEEPIAEIDSLDIKSNGVSKTLLQNGSKVRIDELQGSADAELNYTFNAENSYFLKTPKLSGRGMKSALGIARKIAKLADWDFQKYHVVHQVYHADDFVFLGSSAKGGSISLKGTGEAIRKFIEGGSTSDLSRNASQSLSIEIADNAGPVVMRLFRVKRNGGIY